LLTRNREQFKKEPVGARNRKPVADKESRKWLQSLEATVAAAADRPQTRWINIADREADSYELFWRLVELRASAEQGAAAKRVDLLVRSQHNRALSTEEERLFGHLAEREVWGYYRFAVPRQPGKRVREATLSVRVAEVSLAAPSDQVKYHGHREPLRLWAIQALEENPLEAESAICWRLLSTMPVEDAASAVRQVERYSRRWEIELFHRTLKSGCRAESRQLETAERLGRCLLLDMLVAWRVLALSKAGRGAEAEQPVDTWLEEPEWKALWCYIHQRHDPPDTPPSTGEAMRWVAKLGGFLGRRSDGHPGAMTLWHGLQRLNDFTQAYLLFARLQKDVGNA
jgi:Transposase Tn5 dimerisation domain